MVVGGGEQWWLEVVGRGERWWIVMLGVVVGGDGGWPIVVQVGGG